MHCYYGCVFLFLFFTYFLLPLPAWAVRGRENICVAGTFNEGFWRLLPVNSWARGLTPALGLVLAASTAVVVLAVLAVLAALLAPAVAPAVPLAVEGRRRTSAPLLLLLAAPLYICSSLVKGLYGVAS